MGFGSQDKSRPTDKPEGVEKRVEELKGLIRRPVINKTQGIRRPYRKNDFLCFCGVEYDV